MNVYSRVFDSKVVHYNCEKDSLSLVSPYGWRTLAREVVELREVFFETIMGDFSGLINPFN